MATKKDIVEISSAVLTRELVASKLSLIFEDSIIVDSKFIIVAANEHSAELFQCTTHDLIGKSVNYLSKEPNLIGDLTVLLRNGYFSGQCLELMDTKGKAVKVKLSGIYLGFFSDFNEFIILTIKNLNPSSYKLSKKLKTKEAILENLVYRASHDLRGPIATVLGLVNLARIRRDDEEIDMIIDMIATHSQLLDDRLHTLFLKTVTKELNTNSLF